MWPPLTACSCGMLEADVVSSFEADLLKPMPAVQGATAPRPGQ